MIRPAIFYIIFIYFLGVGASRIGFAAIGEPESSIEGDRKAMSATRGAPIKHASYAVHELISPGMKLREYVSNGGIVFAIAWLGMHHPELQKYLGSYADEYHRASRLSLKNRAHRSQSVVKGENIVVVKSGHMRAERGRAYVLGLFPAGVSVDEIR